MAFSREIRKAVREAQKGRCHDCGMKCPPNSPQARRDRIEFTVDHIKPASEGGSNNRSNARGLCRRCHDQRHGFNPPK